MCVHITYIHLCIYIQFCSGFLFLCQRLEINSDLCSDVKERKKKKYQIEV